MSESNGDGIVTLSEIPTEIPVKIKDKGGELRSYVVREMLGDDFTAWLDRISQGYKTDDSGKVITKTDVKKSQEEAIELIHLCLFDEQDNPVMPDRIRSWPAKTRSRLGDMCQEVNGLKAGKG